MARYLIVLWWRGLRDERFLLALSFSLRSEKKKKQKKGKMFCKLMEKMYINIP